MAKDKPIKDTVHIGKVNLIRLANKVIDKVYENTVYRSKDVKDKPFEEYSDSYKKVSQSSGNKVDLYKSGKMMNSLLIKRDSATDDTIPVGWVNPKSAQKLVWNASDRGKNREVANDKGSFPFAPSVEKIFWDGVNEILDKKVKATSSKQVFKIGK